MNGEKEGKDCEYVSDNNTRYVGDYVNGYRQGSGTIYNADKSVAYKGQM